MKSVIFILICLLSILLGTLLFFLVQNILNLIAIREMRDNPFKYINHNPNNDVYEKTSTKGSPQNTSKSTNLDCFKILGFSEIPTEEELKKQFRLLAKENHPDRGGNPEIFEKITQAYAEASNIIKTINTTK